MTLRIYILLLFLLVQPNLSHAQEPVLPKDSLKFYKDVNAFSKKNKITKFLNRLIFRPIPTVEVKKRIKANVKRYRIQKPYSIYEGKTIRKIYIETLDPFGQSIADTVVGPKNKLVKLGNAVHIKTQRNIIRNSLIIRENQTFDSLKVRESERLIRIKGSVQDVAFYVIETAKNSDSVDIYIRELDKWSIVPRVSFSGTQATLILLDKNILGFGHEFQNGMTWYHTIGDNAYNTNYYIPNIRNSFVTANLYYGTDQYRNFSKSVAVNRAFYSPLTKWAGGVNFSQFFRNDSIETLTNYYEPQRFKYNLQDYWLGNAVQLVKGSTVHERSTNFITAVRFLRIRYLEFPLPEKDIFRIYTDENFYLGSVGISTRKYVQDKYIFRFGITEVVPVGKVINLTGGYQVKNNVGRVYTDLRVAYGNYYEWGYLSSSFEYGVYFNKAHQQQGAFLANATYFTNIFEIGNWKFRQFLKPQLMLGINRFAYDSLTLKDGYGLDGFSSSSLIGTKRILLTVQTQSYAPWNLIGFRFGPFFTCSAGMLGNAENGFSRSRLYSQIGFGVLIKNENLVINAFQLSFSFYPLVPGSGQNIFKFNAVRTTDFGMRDFEIGKPGAIVFQ